LCNSALFNSNTENFLNLTTATMVGSRRSSIQAKEVLGEKSKNKEVHAIAQKKGSRQKENKTPPKAKKSAPSKVVDKSPVNKKTEVAQNKKNEKKENMAKKKNEEVEEPAAKKRGRPSAMPESEKNAKRMKLDVKQTRGVGHILTVGTGDTGQLGLGEDVMEKTRMGLVQGLEGMVDVCAGGMHSVGLSKTGEVWTWGCNDEGALGRKVEEEEEAFVPRKVDLEEKVVMVSAGDSHTAALTENGKVWIWGTFRDASGPIGLVTPLKTEMKPVQIMEEMVKISSGTDHLAMLKEDGTIYTVGNAEQGQLGRVGERFSSRGARRGLEMLLTPDMVKVKGKKNNKFKDVWAGGYDTVATSDDGKVIVMGLNNYGQLGVGGEQSALYMPTLSKAWSGKEWSQVAMGQHHGLGLDNQGQVWAIGRGEYGRLGLGKAGDAVEPTKVAELDGVKCVQVSCGEAVSYAVGDDGKCWSWGMGTNYQLGTGADDDVEQPEVIKGKNIEGRKVLAMYGGGQHAIMLATQK